MNRRSFLKISLSAGALTLTERVWPFRTYSFPSPAPRPRVLHFGADWGMKPGDRVIVISNPIGENCWVKHRFLVGEEVAIDIFSETGEEYRGRFEEKEGIWVPKHWVPEGLAVVQTETLAGSFKGLSRR